MLNQLKQIKQLWRRYCQWLDRNQISQCRSCVPLDERAQKAIAREQDDR